MRKIAKYLAAVCVVALAGALIVGCSGQGSSSAASSSASAQTTDELIAELNDVTGFNNYKSVTMDMKGTMKIDYAAMLSDDTESASAESASAESASAESASAESASAASSEAAESTEMEIPLNISAKADMSGDTAKMYMNMDMLGQNMELYINGDNAVMVVMGQAVSATLEELGMSQYGSIESIMKSQGGDFSQYKDAITSIEKSTENGEAVYKVSIDPSKVKPAETAGSLNQMAGADSIKSMNLTYRVDSSGHVTECDIDMQGKGFSSVINTALYDYDKTVVPDAPEATMKYSDLAGSSAAAPADAVAEAAGSSDAAKAA